MVPKIPCLGFRCIFFIVHILPCTLIAKEKIRYHFFIFNNIFSPFERQNVKVEKKRTFSVPLFAHVNKIPIISPNLCAKCEVFCLKCKKTREPVTAPRFHTLILLLWFISDNVLFLHLDGQFWTLPKTQKKEEPPFPEIPLITSSCHLWCSATWRPNRLLLRHWLSV